MLEDILTAACLAGAFALTAYAVALVFDRAFYWLQGKYLYWSWSRYACQRAAKEGITTLSEMSPGQISEWACDWFDEKKRPQ